MYFCFLWSLFDDIFQLDWYYSSKVHFRIKHFSIIDLLGQTAFCKWVFVYYFYYYSLIRDFHISISRWFFTRVWVMASLLKSPGLFLVFWPFSIMLSFGVVSNRPPTSKFSSPYSNPFSYCSKRTIYNWYYCHLDVPQFFQFPSKFEVLILLFTFFQFYSVVRRDSKVDYFASSLFLLIIIKSGLLAGIRWSVFMLKSHRSLCVAFSRTGTGLSIYHLLVWSNLNFLHISQWITLPTQSCLALYSRCANLPHSLIIWLMVSSRSPHILHLLFCWVLSILALIWLVLMVLSCAAIRERFCFSLKVSFS